MELRAALEIVKKGEAKGVKRENWPNIGIRLDQGDGTLKDTIGQELTLTIEDIEARDWVEMKKV